MFAETGFVQFPDYTTLQNFVNYHGTAHLYGYTLKKFTASISADCCFATPYEFVDNDLYEFSVRNNIYSLKNLSEEARIAAAAAADTEPEPEVITKTVTATSF